MRQLKQIAIRLSLHGCKTRPFYHIVVMKKHKARNDKPLELLGSFDPMPNKYDDRLCALNYDRLQYWLQRDAEPSKPVLKLLGLAGFFPLHPMTYITAKRNNQTSAEAQAKAQEQSKSDLETKETAEVEANS